MRIILLILFFLSVSSQLFAATCKVKDNIKTKQIIAPKALEYKRENSGNRIDQVLSKRKTINLFRAWNGYHLGSKNYGLAWGGTSATSRTPNTISLREVLWAYTYPDKNYYGQPGTEKFVLKKNGEIKHGKNMEEL